MSIQPSPLKSAVETPSAGPYGAADERRARHVLERAVAAVVIQPVRLRAIAVRRAVVVLPGHRQAVDVAVDAVEQVVADEEIEPAVAVVVDERRRHAPAVGIADAGLRGDVGERAVAVVVQQHRAREPVR